jgi:enamine deaminase RidA (YjgF/YER057c/UK114 family)
MSEVRRARSGSPFESRFGFCRALRIGDRVFVAGTAPVWPDGTVDPDPAAQMRRCVDIARTALADLGASLEDVVRTRMFLVDAGDADVIGAVHGEAFSTHPPVATMVVVSALLDPRWRIEIELDAVISS